MQGPFESNYVRICPVVYDKIFFLVFPMLVKHVKNPNEYSKIVLSRHLKNRQIKSLIGS